MYTWEIIEYLKCESEKLSLTELVDLVLEKTGMKAELKKEQKVQIEDWTNLKMKDIVFDSNIHNWNKETSEFDSLILNKQNLIFFIYLFLHFIVRWRDGNPSPTKQKCHSEERSDEESEKVH